MSTRDKTCQAIVTLSRGKQTAIGILGTLSYMGETLCYTLEEPWRNNAPADHKGETESCIPEGRYYCVPHSGARFKNVWRLEDVPNRSYILIHAGNTLADTEGCILVGLRPSPNGVADSQAALTLLRKKLPSEFWLEIRRKSNV